MIIFDGIKNRELKEAIEGFRQLRKEYQREMAKLGKEYRNGVVPEDQRRVAEDAIFSQENFEKILPQDRIVNIKGDITTEMTTGEINLYTLNYEILSKLEADYRIFFLYTGKCISCGSETEQKIPVDVPLTDAKFIGDKTYEDAYSDYIKCGCCSSHDHIVLTQPVKTANLFEILSSNDYHVMMTSVRKKSEGRIIPKFVKRCAGTLKDIRDIHGLKLICPTEEDCKAIPELMLKYNGDDRIKCRDFFEIREIKGKSGKSELVNVKYFFYLDRKGRPKKQYIDEPLEMQIRHGFDPKGRPVKEVYRAVHMPIEFKGTVIEVQTKELQLHQKEHDPSSPLYHGAYSKGTNVHHEEYKEIEMKSRWDEGERRLANYLYETGIFADFNPSLYRSELPFGARQ